MMGGRAEKAKLLKMFIDSGFDKAPWTIYCILGSCWQSRKAHIFFQQVFYDKEFHDDKLWFVVSLVESRAERFLTVTSEKIFWMLSMAFASRRRSSKMSSWWRRTRNRWSSNVGQGGHQKIRWEMSWRWRRILVYLIIWFVFSYFPPSFGCKLMGAVLPYKLSQVSLNRYRGEL